ncbi:hypothetical protein SDC9_199740 [bioreactor metagenome]|uniref:Uncharacterized protein n=1 Tax=bioreactor metagenome TaxID=1076179 RepID=A0A645IM20_9ZZZZ
MTAESHDHSAVKQTLICLAFLSSLVLWLLTLAVFRYCFLPWWTSPNPSQVQMFVGGMEVFGWNILAPLIGFATGAIGATRLGVWMLQKRSGASPSQP